MKRFPNLFAALWLGLAALAAQATTVTAGSTGSYTFNVGESAAISLDPNEQAQIAVLSSTGAQRFSGAITSSRTIGPFAAGDVLTLTAVRGDIDYTVSAPNSPFGAPGPSATGDLLTPSGNVLQISAAAAIKVAGVGDSITQYWNHFITPTTAQCAAGVVTIGATTHGLSQGALIDAYGFHANPTFGARGVAVTRIDANNFSYPVAGCAPGNATIDANYARISYRGWYSNVSAFEFANSRLKGALQLVDNFGQSTEQSSDVLGRMEPILASSADWIIYGAGVNDTTGTAGASALTAAQTIANDASFCRQVLVAGKNVMLRTIAPLGVGHTSFATATPKIIQVNAARRALAAASHGRIRLWDSYAALVDPATGGAKTNALQSDKVHPQTYGARLDGAEGAAAFSGMPLGRFLTTSIADARATYATSPNIWPIGQFTQADAGSKSGPTNAASPPTGSVAGVLAGYNVTATAGAGEVWMAADDDGYGFSQVVSWTPSGAGTVTVQQQTAGTMAAMVAPGGVYRLGMHLKVSGVTSALTFLRVRVQGVFDGVTQVIGTPMHSDVGAASNVFTDFDEYLVGPEMVIPPFSSCTSLTVEVIENFSGATTIHTMTVSRMTFNKVR